MEDKIKALIEKYEAQNANHNNWVENIPCDEHTRDYHRSEYATKNRFIFDLKQLLTTSQGNPERIV